MKPGPISEEMIQQTRAFHGHMCPGLATGIRAAEVALREIGPHSQDEEVVAVVETECPVVSSRAKAPLGDSKMAW